MKQQRNDRFRSAYDGLSVEDGLACNDESLTVQGFSRECDVNYIVERFTQTGSLQHVTNALPQFGDFLGVGDFTDMMNTVVQAQEAFDALPAKLRTKFNNSPEALLNWIQDDSNYSEAVELGLLSDDAVARFRASSKVSAGNPPSPASPVPAAGQAAPPVTS